MNEAENNEIRIDVTRQTPEELALAAEHAQLIFRFNHTIPGTDEYNALMHRIFPSMGGKESCHGTLDGNKTT